MNTTFKLHKKLSNFCSFRILCCGFVFDGNEIETAVVEQTKKGPILLSFERKTIGQEALFQLKNVSQDTTYIGTTLPSTLTLMRPFTLPPLPNKEIPAAINDLLEQNLATHLEEACFVYEITGKDAENTTLAVFISREADVEATLAQAKEHTIDPHLIIPKANALAQFIKHFHLSSWQLILDINDQEISYILLHDYKTIESRVIAGSAEVFANIPCNTMTTELEPLLQRIFETTHVYKERFDLPAETPLTVTGKASFYELAPEIISEYIQVPLSTLHNLKSGNDCLQCATAIGTAFCCNPSSSDGETLNFRHGCFAHKNPLMHWKRPLISLTLSSLTIAGAILWSGFSSHAAITKQMREEWTALLAITHTDSEAFKNSHAGLNSETPEELLSSGHALLSDVEKQALFPLDPKIPKVKDVFSWLSMQIAQIQKKIGDTSTIEIQNLRYNLMTYPSKKTPKDRYLVHISVEFTTTSVALARAFHEHIINACPFVQNPGEVTWSPSAGKYKVGFYAKDLTLYPPMNV